MELSLQETLLQSMWLGAHFFCVHWKTLGEVKGKQIAILDRTASTVSQYLFNSGEGWEGDQ